MQRADLYVCLLGADATAPVGAEWSWAQRAGASTLAYRKEVHRSPSATHFLRASPGVWTPFADAHDLRRRLRPDLARRLIDRATVLGLHLNEVETLSALIDDESAQPGAEPAEDRRRGAGKGGVILGREGPEEP
ncbi:MAG: hypothetical protein M5R40_27370 [Anaerolineae bacterium]|nr:hypothetical protein [Anaerolineae bacterium]